MASQYWLRWLGRETASGYRMLVYIHQNRVILFRRVFGLVFPAGFLAHFPHTLGMRPCPFHFAGQVRRVARVEVQPGAAIFDYFSHGSQAGANDRRSASKSLGNRARKVFVPFAAEDQKTCTA